MSTRSKLSGTKKSLILTIFKWVMIPREIHSWFDPIRLPDGTLIEFYELYIKTVNTYNDLPDPSTVLSGRKFSVVNDPDIRLNRIHTAGGADIGNPATAYF